MNDVHVTVEAEGDRVCLGISGDVDLSNAANVETQLTVAIPNWASAVELDLSDVTYLDSAGLQVVFALTVKLRRLQIDLRIVAPDDSPARHAIDMAGMGSIAQIGST